MRLEVNSEATLSQHSAGQMVIFAALIVLISVRSAMYAIGNTLLSILFYFVPLAQLKTPPARKHIPAIAE